MIDLQVLREAASGGPGEERIPMTRRALREIVREIEQGRAAIATVAAGKQMSEFVAGLAGQHPVLDIGDDG